MRALVTGAGKRLGREMALYLARRGYDVAVHYAASRKEAEEVVKEIAAMGRRACALHELGDGEQDLHDGGEVARCAHVLETDESRARPRDELHSALQNRRELKVAVHLDLHLSKRLVGFLERHESVTRQEAAAESMRAQWI